MHKHDLSAFTAQTAGDLRLLALDLRLIGDRIVLDLIWVHVKRQGTGTEAMTRLCRWADERGLTISLDTAGREQRFTIGTTSSRRLISFYRRFGFVSNRGRNMRTDIPQAMYRLPAARAEAAA